MKTITSNTVVIYYNHDDDNFQYDENKKYYTKSLRYKTYYVGDPRNEIRVTYYVYYEVDKNGNVTNNQINVDLIYNIKNLTTGELLKNKSGAETVEYINSFTQKQLEEQEDNNEEFVNTTGHTEQSEEDLEEYTGVSLFDDSNIIEEDMYGVSVQDNEYHQGKETDVNQQIKDTVALQDVTTLAAASVQNAEDEDIVKNVTNTVTEDKDGTRTSKNTLDAAIGLASAVDQFGHYLTKGGTCPICGKHIDFMPGNGYCSLTCAAKDLLRKITETLSGKYKVETPEIIDRIKNILDYFNLVLNVVQKVPDILAGTATMPKEYRDYVTA